MTSLVMSAWQEGGCYGVKVINTAPGRMSRGGRAVFKSVGRAREDLAPAILVHGADAGQGH
ncbi:MAG: hypothetical protein ACXWUL_11435 [Caldimonas sp.]